MPLLSFAILDLVAIGFGTATPEFQHVPIKDVVVGESLLVEKVSEELA